MPKPEFSVQGLPELVEKYGNKAVGDAAVRPDLLAAKAEYGPQWEVGGVTFSITVGADARIYVFNSKDDKDALGVIGTAPKEKEDEHDELELAPQIEFSEKNAWMKYEVEAGVKASAGGELSALGFEIVGEKKFRLADYHLHPNRAQTVADALRSDLSQIRFAARREDVLRLGTNEALAFRVAGQLSASVELTWSDVLTANLNGLSRLLRSNSLIGIKTSLGASVAFHVGVQDEFILIFSRPRNGFLRVAVKKAQQQTTSFTGKLEVTAEFADPKAVESALNDILEQVIGQPVSVVDKLLEKASLGSLGEKEKALLDELLGRLKLDDLSGQVEELKEQWEELKKKVKDTVKAIAKAKVSAAFKYEYLRVHSRDTVLQGVIPDQALGVDLHLALLKKNLAAVLEWMRAHRDQVELEKFLHQEKLTTKQTWGLFISLGKWTIGGQDIKAFARTVQKNFEGHQRITYLGQRGYEGTWGDDKVSWMADFSAQMENFSPSVPGADEFQYQLSMKWKSVEKKLEEKELRKYLDHAVIWGAVENADVEYILEGLRPELQNKAEVGIDLVFGPACFRPVLRLLASASDEDFARALAKAMPWWEKFQARTILERRERLYKPLWAFYLNRPDLSPRDYARQAEKILGGLKDGKEIAGVEGLPAKSSGGAVLSLSFSEIIRLNSQGAMSWDYAGTQRKWKGFQEGVRTLVKAIAERASHEEFKGAFHRMNPLCAHALHARALGVLALDLAATSHDLLAEVESTLTIEFPDREAYTFSSASTTAVDH